ncbi:MAG: SPOR domain-containing protein [Bacteroidota bacterium]|nr:SPOR domain-containing protein [Bacteroidota bacterium]
MRYYFLLGFLILFGSAPLAQELTVSQSIPSNVLPGSDFLVEITISKGSMGGFMKFFQEVPAGFSAAEVESKTGSFTFTEGSAKIIWMTPPAESSFSFSYKISVPKDASGSKSLGGKVSYIINNERKIVDIEPKTFNVGTVKTQVKTDTKTETKNNSVTTSKPAVKPIEKTAPKVDSETSNKTNTISSENKTEPKTETKTTAKQETKEATKPVAPPISTKVPVTAAPSVSGKTYRVQIGAFSAKPKVDGVPEITTVILENGITKYFSGNFSTYEEAAKRKKEMTDKGFQGAFIVSFENGKIVK